jgi:hypothetical protein
MPHVVAARASIIDAARTFIVISSWVGRSGKEGASRPGGAGAAQVLDHVGALRSIVK